MELDAQLLVDRVMALWSGPIPDGPAGLAAFGECYAAELTVNGVAFTLADRLIFFTNSWANPVQNLKRT
jgi:hypothetical protein